MAEVDDVVRHLSQDFVLGNQTKEILTLRNSEIGSRSSRLHSLWAHFLAFSWLVSSAYPVVGPTP